MTSSDLVKLFIEDSLEAVEKLESNLLKIEQSCESELVNELFRAIHSIKGGASLLEYSALTKLAHVMENYLGAVREGTIRPTRDPIDALLEGTDLIRSRLDDPAQDFEFSHISDRLVLEARPEQEEVADQAAMDALTNPTPAQATVAPNPTDDIAMLLQMSAELGKQLGRPPVVTNPAISSERVPSSDIAQLLSFSQELKQQLEDPTPTKPPTATAAPSATAATTASVSTSAPVSDPTLRIYVNKLNKLVDLAGELVLARNQLLTTFKDQMQNQQARNLFQNTDRVTTQMQTEIMSMRMQPVSLLFDKFPRLVRDLSAKLKKNIKVCIEGENVELDKTMIEAISNPLNHLVRNCADHGIELPDERKSKGKRPEGKIILKAYHSGGLVHIEISDDGRGMDPEKIARIAVEKGVITKKESEALSADEKIKLIFAPGFSTAETISDVSGRGVGMDVVRTDIEKVGGSVDIETILGKGSSFKITLPLTLAIISSLIVQIEEQNFAIPQVSFEELIRVSSRDYAEKIALVGGGQVLRLRGELIPLVHLADCIDLERTYVHPQTQERLPERRKVFSQTEILEDGTERSAPPKVEPIGEPAETSIKIMIVSTGEVRIGLIVDKILCFEEIIVKSLPAHLRYLHSYAGVTILGDGKVALIIDVHGIALRNKLIYEKAKGLSQKLKKSKQVSNDKIMLLLFDNNQKERYALPLGLIQRVDKIDIEQIQELDQKQYINYMGNTTRLVDLPGLVSPHMGCEKIINIIIPKKTQVPIALKIGKIIDTREVSLKLEDNTIKNNLFLGTSIIDDEITVLINFHGILEHYEPHCFQHLSQEQRGKKVLLVEDTPLYQKMTRAYLEEEGYQVMLAENGEEASTILEKQSFDIVVTDIEMPVMNGFDLAARIRSMAGLQTLPIVALTSLSNKEMIDRGMKAGITKWLNKLDRNELMLTLKALLENVK